MERRARVLAPLAAYLVATLLFTWPLAAHLRSRLPAPSSEATWKDTLLLAWVLSWDVHQLVRAPLHLFDANIFHPLRRTLGFSEAFLSQAILVLPLRPLTPDPVLLHNAVVLLSFLLGAWGTFLLVRHLTGSSLAAFVAGLLFAFAPYRFWQIDRLNSLVVHWTPFLFLALHRYLDTGGAGRAAALGLVAVLQALASIYVAYATAVLLGLFLAGWLIVGPPGSGPRVLRAGAVLAVAAALVAVVYSPYALVRDEMALARDPVQVIMHSVVPVEVPRAIAAIPAYLIAKVTTGMKGGGTIGALGGALLCVAAVAGKRIGRLYVLLALAALLLSFGPVVVLGRSVWLPGPYRLLYEHAPGFTALREPRRMTGFVVACGAIAAGLGLAALLARVRSPRSRALVTVALVAGVAVEVGWRPLGLAAAPALGARAAVYRTIAESRADGALVELPIGTAVDEVVTTFRSSYHLRPMLNGWSGFNPTTEDLRRRLRRFPSRSSVAWLRRVGARFVLYDTRRRGAFSPRALNRRLGRAAPGGSLAPAGDGLFLAEVEPLPPRMPDGARAASLPRDRWRVRASEGTASAAIDGDLATHWVAGVDPPRGGGWFEVDFGEPVEFDRVTLELGSHYGEYPRAWRLVVRDGGGDSEVAARSFSSAPLISYRADPARVVVDLGVPLTRARVLRIEVPPLRFRGAPPRTFLAFQYWGWVRWGIHELRVSRSAPGASARRDARSLLPEEPARVDRLPLDEDLVVEVGPRASPGAPDEPDHLALLHLLPGLHLELLQMPVERPHAVPVIERHMLAVVAAGAGRDDGSRRR